MKRVLEGLWIFLEILAYCVLAVVTIASIASIFGGCTDPLVTRETTITSTPKCPTETHVTMEVKVICMDPPPRVSLPTWPDPDSTGNLLMHESTAEMIRRVLDTQAIYISQQYAKCASESQKGW